MNFHGAGIRSQVSQAEQQQQRLRHLSRGIRECKAEGWHQRSPTWLGRIATLHTLVRSCECYLPTFWKFYTPSASHETSILRDTADTVVRLSSSSETADSSPSGIPQLTYKPFPMEYAAGYYGGRESKTWNREIVPGIQKDIDKLPTEVVASSAQISYGTDCVFGSCPRVRSHWKATFAMPYRLAGNCITV
ncbi:hypothetical protein CBL_11035 [Carabus blaptoides fortunei]